MSYRLVKGTFALFYQGERHVGSRPDGDSLWFRPDKPSLLRNLGDPPRRAEFNGGGFAQLRFEGIDALELHYPGSDHQSAPAAVAARDFLLQRVGFSQVQYAPNPDIPTSVRSSTPQSIRGHILTRNIDPFRRPVAFVYPGSAPESDSSSVFLRTPRLNRSLNAKLMKAGHVYPAYYTGLPVDLRYRLTYLAVTAWNADRGLWPVDDSRSNPRIRNQQDLMQLAIWPKLYRRLAKYFDDDNTGLAQFDSWLRDEPGRDDRIWIIPRGELARLHNTFTITGNRITMNFWPEELIIVPR